MPVSKFDDPHRIFLQTIMSKGILSAIETKTLIKKCLDSCQLEVPEDRAEFSKLISEFIAIINKELDDCGMKLNIAKGVDEDRFERKSFYVLVNQIGNRDVAKIANSDFTEKELCLIRVLVSLIMESRTKTIDNMTAINCGNGGEGEFKMSTIEVESAIKKIVAKNWLQSIDGKFLRLSTRFITEMSEYLKNHYKDDIRMCTYCKTIVVRAITCSNCDKDFHLHCLGVSYKNTKNKGAKKTEMPNSMTCPLCKNENLNLKSQMALPKLNDEDTPDEEDEIEDKRKRKHVQDYDGDSDD